MGEHGHTSMMRYIKDNNIKTRGKVMVEIGSTREKYHQQQSTTKLGRFCNENGILFITVDMDPENTEVAKKDLKDINLSFKAICKKGEDYLRDYEGEIDFIYLDAYDFYHKYHSEKRKKRYIEILGDTINDESCWKMHYECAVHLADKMSSHGLVVFDDTHEIEKGVFKGKGKTAVPYFITKGFKVESDYNENVIMTAPFR